MSKVSIHIPYSLHSKNEERARLCAFVINRWRTLFPNFQLSVSDDPVVDSVWNRSRARNNSINNSDSDYIVIADADTICPSEAITDALDYIEGRKPFGAWVLPYHDSGYYNLTKEYTERILGLDPKSELPSENELIYEHKIESWAGILVMSRKAWDTVGGYDESFIGWGYEDNAFRLALDTLWTRHTRLDYPILHLWHSAPEDTRFGQPNISHNQRLYQKYVAAYGNIRAMRHVKGLDE